MLVICFAALAVTASAASDPFLRTHGTEIRDAKGTGDRVLLRGVNLGGWLVIEAWMTPMDASGLKDDFSARQNLETRFGATDAGKAIDSYEDAYMTEADLDRIAGLGLNVVRIPFWYRNVETENGVWRTDAFKRLDWIVAQAWKRHIYSIIDFHGLPGGQSDADHTGRVRKENGLKPEFFSSEVNIQRATAAWSRIAAHFKANPGVAMYDLINEPAGAPSREALWTVYNRLYQKIRAVDPEHIITIEGCWGGWVNGKYVGWGWDALPPRPSSGGPTSSINCTRMNGLARTFRNKTRWSIRSSPTLKSTVPGTFPACSASSTA